MIKLVMIGIAILVFSLVGWIGENYDQEKKEIIRMADRDRAAQAVRPMARRLQYARFNAKK